MGIPRNEVVEMTTLERLLTWIDLTKSTNQDQLRALIRTYSNQFTTYMDRFSKYQSRETFFDLKEEYPFVHLRGYPFGELAGVPIIDCYNDGVIPPTYATALTIDEDFIPYQGEEYQGLVKFISAMSYGFKTLKVEYSGGMATRPDVIGTDGATVALGVFNSAKSTFQTDLVEAGQTLIITSTVNGNEGEYNILTIPTENQLTVSPVFPNAPAAAETFYIEEAGFVGQYPDIENALILQIMFHWKQKDNIDAASIALGGGGAGGTTVNYIKGRPLDLLPEVKAVLEDYKFEVYP